jgi:TRAP-type mannitol/chloroaromatic compound transport system permease small subunit
MSLLKTIDAINDWVGRVFSLTLLLIMLLAVYEVVRRYIFNNPTTWVWEINSQLLCLIGALAGGYALLNKAHVSVDIVSNILPPRVRAIVNVVTWPFFFILTGSLVYYGFREAWQVFQSGQRVLSQFASPLWPVKTVIPIGACLLLLQGMATLTRDILIALGRGGQE